MFGEREQEYSKKQGKKIPVWQTPKYLESKKAAVDIINGGKYGLSESDFWILMNETKDAKMAYTGLIMSHNGALKVNDALADKFRPECVSVDKDGWGASLVCFYNCPEQGLFEVGEVSSKNCQNGYPYAMAVKRLFDRVVLKLSKLAYCGIYGEDEADDFKKKYDEPEGDKAGAPDAGNLAVGNEGKKDPPKLTCENCSLVIVGYKEKGRYVPPEEVMQRTQSRYRKTLCKECAAKEAARLKADKEQHEQELAAIAENARSEARRDW